MNPSESLLIPASNARFWQFLNDGFVKLTLRPGQSLAWGKAARHDEGWSSEWQRWEWDGRVLVNTYGTDGTDCDGRLSTEGESFCHLQDLKACPQFDWEKSQTNPPLLRGIRSPEWTQGRQRQRDYRAEAMGY